MLGQDAWGTRLAVPGSELALRRTGLACQDRGARGAR